MIKSIAKKSQARNAARKSNQRAWGATLGIIGWGQIGLVSEFSVAGALTFHGSSSDVHAFEAAQTACARYRPRPIPASPAEQAAHREAALKFARCMRSHGVNVPDPIFKGEGGGIQIQGGPGGLNPNSPTFQAAQNACQGLLGKDLPKGGGPTTSSSHGGGSGATFSLGVGG